MRPFLILLLLLSAVAQSPKQHTDDKQTAQPQVNKPADNKNVPDAGEPPETKFYTYNNQETEGDETAKEIGDYLLALFTLALVVVSVMQWRVLREHEHWMEKHDAKLEKLARSAEDNSKAAKISADISKDSFQSIIDSERAWVVADAPRIQTDIASGQSVRVLCTIRNRGKTMARVVEKGENYSIEATAGNLQDNPGYNKTANWPDGVVLSPASESVLTRTLQVADSETWQKVMNGSKVLFVFGFVKYRDVFNREHETRYIFRFETTWERGGAFYVEYKKEYNRAT